MSVDWPRFCERIRTHQRFVLTSHIRPDCDALGSELGMAGVLAALGKQTLIVNGQATPPNLAWIDPRQQIKALHADVAPAEIETYDALLVLDTSAWAQLGPMGEVLKATKLAKLVLDHHASEDDLGAEMFKDVAAEATGRLVADAAGQLGVKLTPEIAEPLFAAVATDTGWFRFPSSRGGTLRTAAALIDAGAEPPRIYRELYERDTFGRVKLRGLVLARMEVELTGRLAHTHILNGDFAATGALRSETEDLVNELLTVAGTEAAAIFVEQERGGFKLSFRSRKGLDCRKLAEQFGGGGHQAAAGAYVPGSLAEAQPRVLDALRAAMR